MKYIILFLLLFPLFSNAQVSDKISFQAVVYDNQNKLVVNRNVGVRMSIISGSVDGTTVYQETHLVTTSGTGLFTLQLGGGTPTIGTYGGINWGASSHFLKREFDINGGTNYQIMGIGEILSVPYAIHASVSDTTLKVPDNSSTNEIQVLSISNDSIFLSSGGFVKLPKDKSFTHYIGEEFGGGVVFHLWKDNSGIEHGLIVSPSEIGEKAWSNVTSNIIGTSAQSLWDGLNNSIAIINQSGHTNSAAKFCLDLVLGDYNDWYLPSIDELSILWQNRFNVNKTLSTIVGGVIFSNEICEAEFSKYWSSTEYFQTMSWYFNFCSGAAINEQKINSYQVRAIRAF